MLASFRFRRRGSIIEAFDPRARWIFSLAMMVAIIQFWDVRFLLFFFVIALVQYLLCRLTWRETRRAWILLAIILTSMVVLNTLITSAGTIGSVMEGNHPLFTWQGRVPLTGWPVEFTLTVERVWFAVAQVLRVLSIAMLFMILPFTTDPRQYGVTFRGLGLPDKLAFTIDLAFRFIPTLSRDFQTTLDAQRARGYELERLNGGFIAQARRVAPLIVPVTMNSILTGEDVANAMDLRCFGLRPRTWIQVLRYRWFDYALISFSVAVLVSALLARFAFGLGDFWLPGWLVAALT